MIRSPIKNKRDLRTPASVSPVKKIETDMIKLDKIRSFSGMATMKNRDSEKFEVNFLRKEDFSLRKMRIHYFFTEKDANLDNFIENTEIEVRITDGANWNKVMYKATCTPLIHFKVVSLLLLFRVILKSHTLKLSKFNNFCYDLQKKIVKSLFMQQ